MGRKIESMDADRHDLQHDLEEALKRYIDLNREVIEEMTGTESIAEAVHAAIDDAIAAVHAPVHPDAAGAVRRLRALPKDYLEPAFELFAARAFMSLLPDLVHLESRAEGLVTLIREASPSARATATLSKVTRSYLFSLDPETIAMCRAAVDVSVSDAIESLDAMNGRERPVSMRQKLDVLVRYGRLSEADRNSAVGVWRRGNEVLHSNIDNVSDAPEVVAATVRVIAALFPRETAV
jgi:hypothetical protein